MLSLAYCRRSLTGNTPPGDKRAVLASPSSIGGQALRDSRGGHNIAPPLTGPLAPSPLGARGRLLAYVYSWMLPMQCPGLDSRIDPYPRSLPGGVDCHLTTQERGYLPLHLPVHERPFLWGERAQVAQERLQRI